MASQPTTDTSRRVATAFFDSREAAEAARRDLAAAGFSPEAIASLAGEAEANEEPILPEDGGFWHALKAFFLPEQDRHAYAEGLRRGGFVLSVTTSPDDYDRALDILDADGAVDIDERARDWRSEGWAGWQEGIEPLAGNLGRPDNSTAGFGASFAGEDGFQPPLPLEPVPPTVDASDNGARADAGRVGIGDGAPGTLNPDMRERIGAGTASMTPPTPTGSQDAVMRDNAAALDRKAAIEEASLGSPTRDGAEMESASSTIGSTNQDRADAADPWTSRRDPEVRRPRVRGFIVESDPRP